MIEWSSVWSGSIWTGQQSKQPNGKLFERVVRSPGSRLIFVRDGKVLLNKEKRQELGGKSDYRLPGGKVFDLNSDFQAFLTSGNDILAVSKISAAKEAHEEVGIIVDIEKLNYECTDVLGTTCTWDLIYWSCDEFMFDEKGAHFHDSEANEIEGFVWLSMGDACKLALDSTEFSESRSAQALLRYAATHGYISLHE